jgi:hypothetical protein
MAGLMRPETTETAPKRLFQIPLRNSPETVRPETTETIVKQANNKAKQHRNSINSPLRNSETNPCRGGEIVSPLSTPPALSLWRLRLRLRAPSLRADRMRSRPQIRQNHSRPRPRAVPAVGGAEVGGVQLLLPSCAFISASRRLSTGPQFSTGQARSSVNYQQRNVHPPYPLADIIETAHIWSRSCLTDRQTYGANPRLEGFYARGLPHSLTFLGSNGAHQAAGAMRKTAAICRFRGKRPGWGGGGRKPQAAAVLRRASPISRPCLLKSGRPCPEKVGRPAKLPALTQSGGWIRQIALAATPPSPNQQTRTSGQF